MTGDVGREGERKAHRWSAREIARRNQVDTERPLSPVMKTAVTACELSHGQAARRLRD